MSELLLCRDPAVPWVFMSYESATNVRQRSSNWGRFPPIDWHRINHVFNRTMGFRRDSDVVVRCATVHPLLDYNGRKYGCISSKFS